jgi:hypothetical protein
VHEVLRDRIRARQQHGEPQQREVMRVVRATEVIRHGPRLPERPHLLT